MIRMAQHSLCHATTVDMDQLLPHEWQMRAEGRSGNILYAGPHRSLDGNEKPANLCQPPLDTDLHAC